MKGVITTDKNYISHHGIKGMRWGVRRTPEELGHVPAKTGSEKIKMAVKKAIESRKARVQTRSENKTKYTKDMTDADLRKAIDRKRLEKEYETLLSEEKSRKNSEVKTMFSNAVRELGKRALGVAVDKIIDGLKNKNNEGDFTYDDFKKLDLSNASKKEIDDALTWYNSANKLNDAKAKYQKAENKRNEDNSNSKKNKDVEKKEKKQTKAERDAEFEEYLKSWPFKEDPEINEQKRKKD